MSLNRYHRLFLSFLLALAVGFAYGQQEEPWLRSYFGEVKAGHSPADPRVADLPADTKRLLDRLSPYLTDTATVVRARAYRIVWLSGRSSKMVPVRQQAVDLLMGAGRDDKGGNSGMMLEYLTSFGREDFSIGAKDSLRFLLRRKTGHIDRVAKLIGFLEMKDMREELRALTMPGRSQTVRWAALVSLVRMNDGDATEDMMERVRKHPVNDDVVYELFPSLVYSRHPEAIAYMVEALNSDEKNCHTADAEREAAMPCGYRVMEQLAPVIDKYPVQLDESGDVKTKDYTAALRAVREWFAKNKNYKILRDRY